MRSLSKDFKSQRPLLVNPAQAEAYLERCASISIPLGAKVSDMGDMLSAIFGEKPVLEKFPPFAVVPVKGMISKGLTELESLCGACDVHDIEEMLEECEKDDSIKTIILDVDSPGGTSVGVLELSNRIKNCSKEVISFTSSECCSAAYWLASQASAGFYATPSSCVGSIGVYIAYPDCSEAYKMEGVKMDVIRSGLFKGAGIPGTSLDANQRKMLQDEVDEIHAEFKQSVKSVRSFVEDSSMEGQTFSGKKAAEAGLVTGLVNGFDEMMESLNAGIAEQMEADEENDEKAEESEEEEGDGNMIKSAAIRALGAKIVNHLSASAKSRLKAGEGQEDEEDEEKDKESPESEDDEVTPEDEKDSGEKPNNKDDEDKPEAGDEEEPKSEDDEEEKKPESNDDEEPKSEDEEEEPKSEEGKEDAEKESDTGDKAVDTDEDADKSKNRRNKSRGIA
jgi:signal peptide peptidase SppA